MLIPKTREEALRSVEDEVRAEQASALGRIGSRLESFIAELHQIEQSLVALEGSERTPLLIAHATARGQAELYLWYLTIQREALGLAEHSALNDFYPIPRALRP